MWFPTLFQAITIVLKKQCNNHPWTPRFHQCWWNNFRCVWTSNLVDVRTGSGAYRFSTGEWSFMEVERYCTSENGFKKGEEGGHSKKKTHFLGVQIRHIGLKSVEERDDKRGTGNPTWHQHYRTRVVPIVPSPLFSKFHKRANYGRTWIIPEKF